MVLYVLANLLRDGYAVKATGEIATEGVTTAIRWRGQDQVWDEIDDVIHDDAIVSVALLRMLAKAVAESLMILVAFWENLPVGPVSLRGDRGLLQRWGSDERDRMVFHSISNDRRKYQDKIGWDYAGWKL